MDPLDRDNDHRVRDDHASVTRREERVRTSVERVATERVIVRRRIVEEERTITVPVRREVVEIIREPVGETTADPVEGTTSPWIDDEIEVLVRAEEPVVTTEVRVVERVLLRRRVVQDVAQVEADVSREEVELEHDEAERR